MVADPEPRQQSRDASPARRGASSRVEKKSASSRAPWDIPDAPRDEPTGRRSELHLLRRLGWNAPAVLFYTGPPIRSRFEGLGSRSSAERRVPPDLRGSSRSGRKRQAARRCAYALPRRAADAVAVLDALEHRAAHFLGSSWGARLGYALGEHAPERVLSLVLCGNQPYAWNLESPIAQAVAAASPPPGEKACRLRGDLRDGARLPLPGTGPDVDPREERPRCARRGVAVHGPLEGPVSQHLAPWRVPCLICVGEADEMRDDAERAAEEIPGASSSRSPATRTSRPSTRRTICCSRTSSSSFSSAR